MTKVPPQARSSSRIAGAIAHSAGVRGPNRFCCIAVAIFVIGCEDAPIEYNLEPVQLGMNTTVTPSYDDGELTLFEVRRTIQFPIVAPDETTRRSLRSQDIAPFGRHPWVTTTDVDVQVSWTLSNLDEQAHNVEVLIDPWNEFGRYVPGFAVIDADNEELLPNFSGIDRFYVLEGTGGGEASRRHGTFTFDDMRELAIDFATVINIIENPPTEGPGANNAEDDPRVAYVNHAFAFQNLSARDALVQGYIPAVIPGLTGIDIGLRTYEPANVAIEVVVELVDKGTGRVREKGSSNPLLEPAEELITIGAGP